MTSNTAGMPITTMQSTIQKKKKKARYDDQEEEEEERRKTTSKDQRPKACPKRPQIWRIHVWNSPPGSVVANRHEPRQMTSCPPSGQAGVINTCPRRASSEQGELGSRDSPGRWSHRIDKWTKKNSCTQNEE